MSTQAPAHLAHHWPRQSVDIPDHSGVERREKKIVSSILTAISSIRLNDAVDICNVICNVMLLFVITVSCFYVAAVTRSFFFSYLVTKWARLACLGFEQKENCTSGSFQRNIHHLSRATPTDSAMDSLRYGQRSSIVFWWTEDYIATGQWVLVAGWSLFRSPRPCLHLYWFLHPFFSWYATDLWLQLIGGLLVIPPRGATSSGIIDIRREWI